MHSNSNKSVSDQTLRSSIHSYYQDHFLSTYKSVNSGANIDVSRLEAQLSPTGKLLQYSYISNNTNPLGSKDALVAASDGTLYEKTHRHYHPTYRHFLNAFGYYDVFLVDASTGNIVYSVFKELDYATSLKNGAYANSGIGEAYREALQLSAGESVIIDFKPYVPSYEAPASFIASPVYEGSKKLGVLIFQAPVDRINEIMTYQNQWAERGLGASGETYLVGPDKLMRSQSRFLLEDKTEYLIALEESGLDQSTINQIDIRDSSLGIAPVETTASERALEGESGYAIIKDYRNISVASAYSHFMVGDHRWAILSEIDEAEAFAAKEGLVQKMILTAVVLTFSIVALGLVAAYLLGAYLARPIMLLNEFVVGISQSLDLTNRAVIRTEKKSDDEIGQVAHSLNTMMDSIHDAISQVGESSNNLNQSVSALRSNFEVVSDRSNQQFDMTMQLSSAIEEMTKTSDSLATSSEQSKTATHDAVSEAESGKSSIQKNVETSNALQTSISKTSKNIEQLASDSQNIGSVLEVIQGIAEQTNLLALNAAIEAARAGEQGRGFAVVADEVRSLAQKTQESTSEIQNIIETLQNGSDMAVKSMTTATSHVDESAETTVRVNNSFENIVQRINDIEIQNSQVATASTEQSSVAKDMSSQVSQISEMATVNKDAVRDASQCCNEVEQEYQRLRSLVSQFKT